MLFLPNIPTMYLKDFVAGRCSNQNCQQKQVALGRILTPQCFKKYCSLHLNEWLCNCMLQHVTTQQGAAFLLLEMIYFGVACHRLVVTVVPQQN